MRLLTRLMQDNLMDELSPIPEYYPYGNDYEPAIYRPKSSREIDSYQKRKEDQERKIEFKKTWKQIKELPEA